MSKNEPLVGLFYYINNKVYSHSENLQSAMDIAGYLSSPLSHYDFYYTLPFCIEEDDYAYYPRGRVFYNERDKHFVIYCDRCLLTNRLAIKEIKVAFNLKKQKIRWRWDEQYQCVTCENS
jgi:hypothetical protein